MRNNIILEFQDVGGDDVGVAGDFGVRLAGLYRAGVPVLPGFVVSGNAYCQYRSGVDSRPLGMEIMRRYDRLGSVFSRSSVSLFRSDGSRECSHVVGDANLVKKIFAVWERDDVDDGNAAIVVQKNVVPEVHGVGFTGSEKGVHGHRLVIHGGRGLAQEHRSALEKILRKIHDCYYFPHEVSWLYRKGQLYVAGIKPVVPSNGADGRLKPNALILVGEGASFGVATGPARIVSDSRKLAEVRRGDVVVVPNLNLEFVPALKNASSVVVERGEVTSNIRVISRELNLPFVVGVEGALERLSDGMVVTVYGGSGEIYYGDKHTGKEGKVVDEKNLDIDGVATATKVFVSVDRREDINKVCSLGIKKAAELSVDGLCPFFLESEILEQGWHPKHLIAQGRSDVLTNVLTSALVCACEAFSPRPVVYSLSSLDTREYSGLDGGDGFEQEEVNPMIGYRGAVRYINDADLFNLEVRVIRKVLQQHSNLEVVVPFVRTPQELLLVKRVFASLGLFRGSGFRLWMMLSTPNNAFVLDDFIDVGIDGVVLDVKMLDTLFMGVDRDNELVFGMPYSENRGLLKILARVIKKCLAREIDLCVFERTLGKCDRLVDILVKSGVWGVSSDRFSAERLRKLVGYAESDFMLQR